MIRSGAATCRSVRLTPRPTKGQHQLEIRCRARTKHDDGPHSSIVHANPVELERAALPLVVGGEVGWVETDASVPGEELKHLRDGVARDGPVEADDLRFAPSVLEVRAWVRSARPGAFLPGQSATPGAKSPRDERTRCRRPRPWRSWWRPRPARICRRPRRAQCCATRSPGCRRAHGDCRRTR